MRSILQRVAFALALTAALIVNVRPAQSCVAQADASFATAVFSAPVAH